MQLRFDRLSPPSAVTVDVPARLHLGFLDPNGSLGRAFGSVGLSIDGLGTRITAQHADSRYIAGAHGDAQHARIAQLLDQLHAAYGGPPVAMDLHQASRAHSGLGSGTQLALAVGTAFVRLLGRSASSAELARLTGRGARSGIGMLGFDHGGLIVDGGPGNTRGKNTGRVPSMLARHPFPDAWRVLLVDDTRREGLHGDEERRALASLEPFPQDLAAHLCHLVLMLVLPGVAEQDFELFARGISDLQHTIGAYFAPAQGGVFASPAVAAALDAVAAQQTAGIGQTSWGPTGFAFLPSAEAAARALDTALHATRGAPGIACSVVAASNRGAAIHSTDLQRCDGA
jgi:beta-ribofuranosylaminobenzene 5'-phosphate synthase